MIVAAISLHWMPLSWNEKTIDWLSRQSQWLYILIGWMMLMVFAYYKSDTIIPPIYLQF
jgi:hypothetical protein